MPQRLATQQAPAQGNDSVDAIADLTVSQKILLAAHKLEDAGHTPFTAEALTVGSLAALAGKK